MDVSRYPTRVDTAAEMNIYELIVHDHAPVIKVSGKPFKSGEKIAFPRSISAHPKLGNAVYMFDDGSYVECWRCYETELGTHYPRVKLAMHYPSHWALGHFFGFMPFDKSEVQTYYCDSWVNNMGFWMTNVNDPTDRRNVSERAPDRTYHGIRNYDGQRYLEAKRAFEKNVKPILRTLPHFHVELDR